MGRLSATESTYLPTYIYHYTPLPLNLANKQASNKQATSKQQALLLSVLATTTCPRNSLLSHVAQDTACSWFRAVGAHDADFGAFWRLFGPFLGHIVRLKGTTGLFDTVKSSRTCSVSTVSLRLAVFGGFGGRFGQKQAVFGHKMRSFGRQPPDLAPLLRVATGEFLAQNLDLARPPPRLWDGQSRAIRNPPLFVVFKPQNRPTSRLDPRTSGHLVEPDGSPARAQLGPTVGPPRSPGRKKSFFSKLFPDHLGCSNKCF